MKNYIYLFIIAFVLRFGLYLFKPNYAECDGYLSYGRILYETGVFGWDRQFLSDNEQMKANPNFNCQNFPVVKVQGKSVIKTAFHAIGWPIQIFLLYCLFGVNNVDAVLIYNVIISSLTVLLIFIICKDLFNEGVAIIASLITAFYPLLIIDSVKTLNEPSYLFFLLLSFLFFIKTFKNKSKLYAVLWGISLGISVLIRPAAFLMFFILAGCYYLFTLKIPFKILIFSFTAFVLTLIPWTIRNYIVFKKFIPLTSISGIVLLQGNNSLIFEKGDGSYISDEIYFKQNGVKFSPCTSVKEYSDYSKNTAIQFIKSLTFKQFLTLEYNKLRYGFGLSYKYITVRSRKYAFAAKDIMSYYPVFILSLIYFLIYYKRSRVIFKDNFVLFKAIITSSFLLYLFIVLVFFGYPRYRLYTLDIVLIIMAALSIYFIFENFMNKISGKYFS